MNTEKTLSNFVTALILGATLTQPLSLFAKTNPDDNTTVDVAAQAKQDTQTAALEKPDKVKASPEKIAADAISSLEVTPIPEQTAIQQNAATIIYNTVTNSHLVKDKLEELTAQKVFDRYLESLDPNKLFFLQSDIDSFKVSKNFFLSHIESGNLSHEFDIFKMYRKRAEEKIKYAIQRLHEPFDFEIDEDYVIDREDVSWAKSDKALKDIWRKRIKNDILIEQLNDEELSYEDVLENLQRRYITTARNIRQYNDYDVFQLIMNAYTHSVEPHTAYLTPRASENFDISMSLSLQGIGAVLEADNEYTVIRRIIPGGPADKDGSLQPDERIVGVGQKQDDIVEVIGWRLDDVVDQIRGEKGTDVYLRVLPDEEKPAGKPRIVKITRDNINLQERRAKSVIKTIKTEQGEKNFAIINIDSFYIDFKAYQRNDPNYLSIARDVKDIIEDFDENIDGLIIDLRNNGGGGLPEAITLAGLFIEKGPVVQIQHFFGDVKVEEDKDPKVAYDGPLAVLINQYSASASEIFAGAIQDYHRGILIGEATFGKGTVQNVLQVKDLRKRPKITSFFDKDALNVDMGQLNLTMAQFFRVNGSSTQHRGVIPDVTWSTSTIDEETGERAYENSIPWRMIEPSEYTVFGSEFDSEIIQTLSENHQARSEEDIDFIYFKKLNELRQKQKDRISVSLNKEKRLKEHNDIEQQLFEIENEKRVAKGEEPYDDIDSFHEAKEAERKEKRLSEEPEFDDPYLLEAARILNDFISA